MSGLTELFSNFSFYWGLVAIPVVGLLVSSHCLIMCGWAFFLVRRGTKKRFTKNTSLFMALGLFLLVIFFQQHLSQIKRAPQGEGSYICLPFLK